MRFSASAGFGKRSGETGESKDRDRASDRLHNVERTHRNLSLEVPVPVPGVDRARAADGVIERLEVLDGLIYEYCLVA
jgi:hypothetical protein